MNQGGRGELGRGRGELVEGEMERVREGQNNVSALVQKSDRTNSRNGREIFPKLVHYCWDVGQSKYLIQRSKSSEGVLVGGVTRTPQRSTKSHIFHTITRTR